jgi:hypothetical protein
MRRIVGYLFKQKLCFETLGGVKVDNGGTIWMFATEH